MEHNNGAWMVQMTFPFCKWVMFIASKSSNFMPLNTFVAALKTHVSSGSPVSTSGSLQMVAAMCAWAQVGGEKAPLK